MAAQLRHARDNYAVERRLRPIYDLLDCGNNKKALQEVEKALRKWPRLQCARALKALATLRLGREADALKLLDELAEDSPTDDATLLVMTVVCRETHRPHRVCTLYEEAVKQEPASEELHTHLFMAYVRVSDLEQQRRTALALYRLRAKNPYYFWAVMSVVLQATRGQGAKDPDKRNIYLTLAQRMVDRLIEEDRLEAEQEVRLYIAILSLQAKYEEALAFIEGPLGRRLMPQALPDAAAPLLAQLERWHALNRLARRLLRDDPDRWDRYRDYFDSSFKLMEEPPPPPPPPEDPVARDDVDDTPERCLQFLDRLVEASESGKSRRLRGPHLARLELFRRLDRTGRSDEARNLLGPPEDLLLSYFKAFGHKACSVGDLRVYVALVPESDRESLAQRFSDIAGVGSATLPVDEDQTQRHACALQLARICGRHSRLTMEHAKALVSTFVLHCERASLLPERSARDPYAPLSAHLLYDLAHRGGGSRPIVEALSLLERALERRPSDFHCKLLCLKFYHMLGCGSAAHVIYESLDVKHVQMDSLCHLHVAVLGPTALYDLVTAAYDATHKFFAHNFKDGAEHLTFSYKYGSFVKLEELMEWRDRLHGSLHRALALVEKTFFAIAMAPTRTAISKVLGQAGLSSPENIINWDDLRDNRDLGVFAHWDPLTIEDPDIHNRQFEQDKRYVRIKFLLLECLVRGAGAADKAEHDSEESDSLVKLTKTFNNYFEEVRAERHRPADFISVVSPLPSRLIALIDPQTKYKEVCMAALSALVDCVKGEFDSTNESADVCAFALSEASVNVRAQIERQSVSEDPAWTLRRTLESIVDFVEIVSVVTAVVGICSDLAKQASSKRSKRKANAEAPAEPLGSLARRAAESASAVLAALDFRNAPDRSNDLAERFADLSTADVDAVVAKLEEGRAKSLASLKASLRDKIKCLSSVAV